jgi:hypothetical protein
LSKIYSTVCGLQLNSIFSLTRIEEFLFPAER